MLIVGAGSGNDVALALARGAEHVDAVEIDPVLQELGIELHQHRPYQDPRVSRYVEDGRAFLERTGKRYDLFILALPDSLVWWPGKGPSGSRASCSRPRRSGPCGATGADGAFSMYNYYRPDVFARYAGELTDVFGRVGPVWTSANQASATIDRRSLTVTSKADALRCSTFWSPPQDVPRPATDDYPFPYAQGWGLSSYYIVSLIVLLLGSALAVGRSRCPTTRSA